MSKTATHRRVRPRDDRQAEVATSKTVSLRKLHLPSRAPDMTPAPVQKRRGNRAREGNTETNNQGTANSDLPLVTGRTMALQVSQMPDRVKVAKKTPMPRLPPGSAMEGLVGPLVAKARRDMRMAAAAEKTSAMRRGRSMAKALRREKQAQQMGRVVTGQA